MNNLPENPADLSILVSYDANGAPVTRFDSSAEQQEAEPTPESTTTTTAAQEPESTPESTTTTHDPSWTEIGDARTIQKDEDGNITDSAYPSTTTTTVNSTKTITVNPTTTAGPTSVPDSPSIAPAVAQDRPRTFATTTEHPGMKPVIHNTILNDPLVSLALGTSAAGVIIHGLSKRRADKNK